jgi:hypothetical protein
MKEKTMTSTPKASSKSAQTELDKVEKQFEQFNDEVKTLTQDRMSEAPKKEVEQQTKLSQREIQKKNELYLKPKKTYECKNKFNEKFREDWNFKKEYVNFMAENREIIGETLEFWTKPFPGVPCEMWEVPVNKPVWGPRYVAERIKGCTYHRLSMQDRPVSQDGLGTYTGSMVVDSTIQRLDAIPVSDRKSIFMGASGF